MTVTRSLDAVHALTGVRAAIPAQHKDVVLDSGPRQPGPGVGLLPFFLREPRTDTGTGTAPPPPRMQRSLGELAAQPPPESVYRHVRARWADAVAALGTGDDAPWAALNESQRAVVCAVPHRRLSLVRGPPGTGKTHTIVNLLRVLVQCYRGTGTIVLATAFTNIGTDNILEGLLRAGVAALRLGAPTRVREDLRAATLEHKIQSSPLMATLERLRAENARPDVVHSVETRILADVMDGVQVICSTCIAASSSLVASMVFPIVVVDGLLLLLLLHPLHACTSPLACTQNQHRRQNQQCCARSSRGASS